MKKVVAREFLWLLATLVIALPLAFLFLVAMDIVAERSHFSEREKIFVLDLFFVAYLVNFIGIYLIRGIVLAIKTLATAKGEE